MIRGPWQTVALVLICLALYLYDGQQWSMYDRELPAQQWRFLTASFTHYNMYHLISNLSVFLVLGSLFESEYHKFELVFLTLVVTFSTVIFLHFFLTKYDTFAGISCLNFALIGWLFCREGRRYLAGTCAMVLLLVGYEVYVVVYAQKELMSDITPVWQLHLFAAFQGASFYVLHRVLLKTLASR